MTDRPYKNHLRYKHMVARLENLPFYRLEAEVLAEIAKGKRWRIEAAMDALEKNPDRFKYINYSGFFREAGRHGRLTAMHRLTGIYCSRKVDRRTDRFEACAPGVMDGFDMAALNGHYRVAGYLRQFGAQPDRLLGNNSSPRAMSFALMAADMKKIDFLLEAGANPSYHLPGAVSDGNAAVVARLLDAGADVNCKADNHWTPLHLAARSGDMAMVDLLIARGATAQACAYDVIFDVVALADVAMLDRLIALGSAPRESDLAYAVSHGKLDIAQRLVDAGVAVRPEMLVHAVAATKQDPAMVTWCLNNGATPADALAWLYQHEDMYRYASGGRQKLVVALHDLGGTAPSAHKPKPPAMG